MDKIVDQIKKVSDLIRGWIEIATYKKSNYKYSIEDIELQNKDNRTFVEIRYKVVGSRVPAIDTATNLNKTSLFSSFKPEHAQMIVTIATVEALINSSVENIQQKYYDYVSLCTFKINERKRV